MKFFAVISSVLAAAAAEGQFPLAGQYLGGAGLYRGYAAGPYASGYGLDTRFAYGAPVTALSAGPLTAGPVAGPAIPYTASANILAHAAPAYAHAAPAYAHAAPAYAYGAPAIAHAAPAIAHAAPAYAYAAPAYAHAAPAIAHAAPVLAHTVPAIAHASPAYAHAAPIATHAAPISYGAAQVGPVSSQYQAQDEAGNIAYGYQNINSAKQERGNAYGGVEGSYSYVDEAGVHTVNYIADDFGFRVSGDNIPVGPIIAPVAAHPVAPVYRGKRSAQSVAPAPSREAVLTTIQLNPGHAVFYRVFE